MNIPLLNVDDVSQRSGAESGEALLHAPAPECLHELFEEQTDACGEAVALVCGDMSLSYAALELRANRVANYLRQLGVGRGALVGIAFDRSELPIIAILGCLKAGAAYVPIDVSHPDERIRFILAEADTAAVLSERAQLARMSRLFGGRIVLLDDQILLEDQAGLAAASAARPLRTDTGLSPHDLCYVIYTSGTTGRPKGVLTEHRNAVHFVRAFNQVCKTGPRDRVYQGFSLSFDGSVEEMWMAFSNGATLVVPAQDAPRFGNDLARYLAQQRVTYFSTVPTMLTTMSEPVPLLRQLVVSGEVCPPQLVARWAGPGRLMLNVYGPTEATVNATAAVCRPGAPITLGRPLIGYETLILDGDLNPVPQGTMGELYIAGPGIARGYLKRLDLTQASFVTLPRDGRRMYRTGDLAGINAGGELEFFGRLDRQVKIRGFRVELAEIEAVLLEQPHVSSAVVHLHEGGDAQSLAAYVVLQPPSAVLDRPAILAALRARLPAYMVPAFLDVVTEVPLLASGKVDRRSLPAPTSSLIDASSVPHPPATPLEAGIADAWASIFRLPAVGVEQNFFVDLGGHSLLAAQTTALLRDRIGLDLAVRDLYAFPTVRELARLVAQRNPATEISTDAVAGETRNDRAASEPSVGFALLQALIALLLGGLVVLPLAAVVILTDALLRDSAWPVATAWLATSVMLAFWPAMLALSIAAKWLIIGRYRAGAYPLWSAYYFRWWVVARLQAMSGAGILAGTPLMSLYYRLMGAKVGPGCALDTAHCSSFDLVRIGDDTSVGAETQLLGHRVEGGMLRIGSVEIGSRCFIGSHCALGLDVRMGNDSRLDDQSLLPDGAAITDGEERAGAPGQPAEVAVPPGSLRRSRASQTALFTAAAFGLAYVCVLFMALPALPIMWLWLWAVENDAAWLALFVNIAALPLLIAISCLWVALLKAMLLWRAAPGIYDLYSFYYLRHWLAYGLMRGSRALLLPVFTTLYLPPLMRLLGARIGRNAELSTVWSFTPDLLTAGEGSFFADGCFLGGRRTFCGRFELRANEVGRRSFVGNGAMLPPGASLGDNCLLGVLSVPPSGIPRTPEGSDWLGSPAFELPNRHKVGGFDERLTFRPTPGLYVQRALIDSCRILVPALSLFAISVLSLSALAFAYESHGWAIMLAISPLLAVVMAALAVGSVVALKWVVMGKFKPVIVPLWCPYVWLNEMVNGVYESIMAPVVSLVFGTPFAAPLLRLLGCRIGRGCYIATSLFSEFDLVQIGDHVALNTGAVIQNHLFEDRIMKSSHLRIDDRCSVGNMAVVLYDGHMQHDAVLGPLSLLMKGEIVPPASRWHGIPTVRMGADLGFRVNARAAVTSNA